jgi:transcriptional regulator with XRE-family HTH domain
MIESSRSTPLPGLALHRRRRGLTQRQLGELAGVAHTTVQKLESLSRGAYPHTLRKLAIALGVEPGDLVGGDRRRAPRRHALLAAREGPTPRSHVLCLLTLLGLSTPHIGPHEQESRAKIIHLVDTLMLCLLDTCNAIASRGSEALLSPSHYR